MVTIGCRLTFQFVFECYIKLCFKFAIIVIYSIGTINDNLLVLY